MLLATLQAGDACANDIVSMRQVSDLRQEAEVMRTDKLLLVLEFASEDCPYCHKL